MAALLEEAHAGERRVAASLLAVPMVVPAAAVLAPFPPDQRGPLRPPLAAPSPADLVHLPILEVPLLAAAPGVEVLEAEALAAEGRGVEAPEGTTQAAFPEDLSEIHRLEVVPLAEVREGHLLRPILEGFLSEELLVVRLAVDLLLVEVLSEVVLLVHPGKTLLLREALLREGVPLGVRL